MTRTLRAICLVALVGAFPAAAAEYTLFRHLPVGPLSVGGGAPGCAGHALMNLPNDWRSGDAAVVFLTTAPLTDPLRDPLVAMLLQQDAAVVELAAGAPTTCNGDTDAASRLAPMPDVPGELFGALRAVKQQAGAGMVVAIGYGPGAQQALAAVSEAEAAARLGLAGPRFAAAAALGDGSPAFARGMLPLREGATARLALLCDALAAVADGLAEADRSTSAAAAQTCRAAIAPDAALRPTARR